MDRFKGKCVVITGGASGIGLASAKRIIAEGGAVLVADHDQARLDRIGATLPTAHVLRNDAARPEAGKILAKEAARLFGSIDALFLNAGVGSLTSLGEITPEEYRRVVDTNFGGPVFGAQAMAPVMRDGGAMLITASIAKEKGMAASALYSATKGAVRSLVRSLARELATRSIRVNSLSPGPIATDFFTGLGVPEGGLTKIKGDLATANPLGRMGTADEAAAVALFLLSDDASYVTGADYFVDGGDAQL